MTRARRRVGVAALVPDLAVDAAGRSTGLAVPRRAGGRGGCVRLRGGAAERLETQGASRRDVAKRRRLDRVRRKRERERDADRRGRADCAEPTRVVVADAVSSAFASRLPVSVSSVPVPMSAFEVMFEIAIEIDGTIVTPPPDAPVCACVVIACCPLA